MTIKQKIENAKKDSNMEKEPSHKSTNLIEIVQDTPGSTVEEGGMLYFLFNFVESLNSVHSMNGDSPKPPSDTVCSF